MTDTFRINGAANMALWVEIRRATQRENADYGYSEHDRYRKETRQTAGKRVVHLTRKR